MPVVFPAIAVCDGIAMGHEGMKYSLVTRDLIADSTECMARHTASTRSSWSRTATRTCPGLLMAAARLERADHLRLRRPDARGPRRLHKTSLSSMFEAMGAYTAGKITEEKLHEFECKPARPAAPARACTPQTP
jgi:dihydroxy-acid dehydratase